MSMPDWAKERFGSDIPDWAEERWGADDDWYDDDWYDTGTACGSQQIESDPHPTMQMKEVIESIDFIC